MQQNGTPILEVVCEEWDHEKKAVRNVIRAVYPLVFTPENLQKFWDKARQFPTLYGKEILSNPEEFYSLIMSEELDGSITPNGLFYVIDDFVGVFYLTNIDVMNKEASVHYSFFDRRTNGRHELTKEIIKYVFNKYPFQRLNASIPLYASPETRKFAIDVGFYLEGKKRSAAFYKGQWFSVMLYGILRDEAFRSSQPASDKG